MILDIDNSWYDKIKNEFNKPYFINLLDFLEKERFNKIIYPANSEIFSCFRLTSFYNVKVVILGQDPYCNYDQANGLAFSVSCGNKLPPTLINIYKELYSDLGIKNFLNGDLSNWAKQGVLLLNSFLTVEQNKPGSHSNIGWEFFTNFIIKLLSDADKNIIFVLWGKSAYDKIDLIDYKTNIILTSSHPSPISANKGFFGSRPFSKINFNLKMLIKKEIDWRII